MPAGWYHVKIVESEIKPVKPPKQGSYLALTMEVLEGTYVGRKVFTNLNLENENPVAVKIAYEQLSALCYVTGRIQCQDSQELHGIPFQVKLAIQDATGGYDASNNVKGFRNSQGVDPKDIASGGAATTGAAPSAPAAPQPPAAPKTDSAPAAPAAPPAPPPPHDPLAEAVKAGWIKHDSPGWYYKGQEVKSDADVAAMFPAPVAPAAPAAPVAPTAPAAPAAPAAGATPPWQRQ